MHPIRRIALAAAVAASGLAAAPAFAQAKLDFILNWVPGGDHAPYYYAKKMGWYKDAGIDLNLEPGKGSAVAVQKVAAGANQIGLADMPNALTLRGKGADTVGVFNVYANSPQGLYWLKIHLANLCGKDKASFEERVQFTEENIDHMSGAPAVLLMEIGVHIVGA